jgi:D-beta-D-heptose 7-phosphate kinase/D-beta-D-heptose 1-phosphate adenosyltransferase
MRTIGTTEKSLSEAFDRFSDRRVLVVGDIMLDHYVSGDVHRISPEAPVPVVSVTAEQYRAGGAANVAMNLAALGIKTTLIGCVGNDESATSLRNLLSPHGIGLAEDCGLGSVPTIVKTRIVAGTQQVCRIDREAPADRYALHQNGPIWKVLSDAVEQAHGVIVSDYAKGTITQLVYDRMAEIAVRHGTCLAVDPKPGRGIHYHDATLLTPNRGEALVMAGMEALPGSSFPAAEVCRALYKRFRSKYQIVTLGAEGMVAAEDGEVCALLPTQAMEVFDVTGAGDTVIATLVACMTAGCDIVAAAKAANAAAGLAVAKLGTAIIGRAEIASALRDDRHDR